MNQNSLDEAVTVMPVIDTRDVFKGAVCVISNDEDVHVITTDEVGGLRGLYAALLRESLATAIGRRCQYGWTKVTVGGGDLLDG